MKNLIKDEKAVAYLLIVVVGLVLFVLGLAYAFFSDLEQNIEEMDIYAGTPLENSMTADDTETLGLLKVPFKFFLMIALIVIVYFVWVMSQKPERGW